jgi:hypothetical protein
MKVFVITVTPGIKNGKHFDYNKAEQELMRIFGLQKRKTDNTIA